MGNSGTSNAEKGIWIVAYTCPYNLSDHGFMKAQWIFDGHIRVLTLRVRHSSMLFDRWQQVTECFQDKSILLFALRFIVLLFLQGDIFPCGLGTSIPAFLEAVHYSTSKGTFFYLFLLRVLYSIFSK